MENLWCSLLTLCSELQSSGGYLHLPAGSCRLAQEWQTHIDRSVQQMVLPIRVKQSSKADNLSVSPCRNNPNGMYWFEKSCVMKDSILLGKVARVCSGGTLSSAFLLSTFLPTPCVSIRLLRWSTPRRSLQRLSCWQSIWSYRMVNNFILFLTWKQRNM